MLGDEDDDDSLHEDLYAVLNLGHGASVEEVRSAFKRLSLIFHPDKHSDPERRLEATVLFEKIKNAHDILTDPAKKCLYDNYGIKAVKSMGMELISRDKSVKEILAEYEMIREIQDETRVLKLTQPATEFEVQFDCSNFFNVNEFEDPNLPDYTDIHDYFPTLEKMKINQQVALLISRNNTVQISGGVSGTIGKEYDGNLTLAWRKVSNFFIKTWYDLIFNISPGKDPATELTISRMITEKMRAYIGTSASFQLTDEIITKLNWNTGVHCNLSRNIQGSINLSSIGMNTALKCNSTNLKHAYKFTVGLGFQTNYLNVTYGYNCEDGSTKLLSSAFLSNENVIFSYGASKQVSAFTQLTGKIMFGNSVGVKLFVTIKRGSQKFRLPILLSDEIAPVAMVYGTAVPLLIYLAVDRLLYQPWRKSTELEKEEMKSAQRSEHSTQRHKEALSAQELMKEKATRLRDQETVRSGLVILQAVYGKLCAAGDSNNSNAEKIRMNENCLDVTIPLQVMVENSKLIIPPCNASYQRSHLEGFYDPSPNVEKLLYIRYLFHDEEHEVSAKDSDKIALPLEKHLIKS